MTQQSCNLHGSSGKSTNVERNKNNRHVDDIDDVNKKSTASVRGRSKPKRPDVRRYVPPKASTIASTANLSLLSSAVETKHSRTLEKDEKIREAKEKTDRHMKSKSAPHEKIISLTNTTKSRSGKDFVDEKDKGRLQREHTIKSSNEESHHSYKRRGGELNRSNERVQNHISVETSSRRQGKKENSNRGGVGEMKEVGDDETKGPKKRENENHDVKSFSRQYKNSNTVVDDFNDETRNKLKSFENKRPPIHSQEYQSRGNYPYDNESSESARRYNNNTTSDYYRTSSSSRRGGASSRTFAGGNAVRGDHYTARRRARGRGRPYSYRQTSDRLLPPCRDEPSEKEKRMRGRRDSQEDWEDDDDEYYTTAEEDKTCSTSSLISRSSDVRSSPSDMKQHFQKQKQDDCNSVGDVGESNNRYDRGGSRRVTPFSSTRGTRAGFRGGGGISRNNHRGGFRGGGGPFIQHQHEFHSDRAHARGDGAEYEFKADTRGGTNRSRHVNDDFDKFETNKHDYTTIGAPAKKYEHDPDKSVHCMSGCRDSSSNKSSPQPPPSLMSLDTSAGCEELSKRNNNKFQHRHQQHKQASSLSADRRYEDRDKIAAKEEESMANIIHKRKSVSEHEMEEKNRRHEVDQLCQQIREQSLKQEERDDQNVQHPTKNSDVENNICVTSQIDPIVGEVKHRHVDDSHVEKGQLLETPMSQNMSNNSLDSRLQHPHHGGIIRLPPSMSLVNPPPPPPPNPTVVTSPRHMNDNHMLQQQEEQQQQLTQDFTNHERSPNFYAPPLREENCQRESSYHRQQQIMMVSNCDDEVEGGQRETRNEFDVNVMRQRTEDFHVSTPMAAVQYRRSMDQQHERSETAMRRPPPSFVQQTGIIRLPPSSYNHPGSCNSGREGGGGPVHHSHDGGRTNPVVFHSDNRHQNVSSSREQRGMATPPAVMAQPMPLPNPDPLWYDPSSESRRMLSVKCNVICDTLITNAQALNRLLENSTDVQLMQEWEESVHFHRTKIETCLEQLVKTGEALSIAFICNYEVEFHVWKVAYHTVVTKAAAFMRLLKPNNSDRSDEVLNRILNLLDDGIEFYSRLLDVLDVSYEVDLPSLYHDILEPKPLDDPVRMNALRSASHCLLCLGDLAGFKEHVKGSKNFTQARQYYLKANTIQPQAGQPYHQLAFLASQNQRRFDSIFYHMRCLMCYQTKSSNTSQNSSSPIPSHHMLCEASKRSLDVLFNGVHVRWASSLQALLKDFNDLDDSTKKERSGVLGSRQQEVWIHPSVAVRKAVGMLLHESCIRVSGSGVVDGSKMREVNEKLLLIPLEIIQHHLQPIPDLTRLFTLLHLHIIGIIFTKIDIDTYHSKAETMLTIFKTLLTSTPNAFDMKRLVQIFTLNMISLDHIHNQAPNMDTRGGLYFSDVVLKTCFEMVIIVINLCCEMLAEQRITAVVDHHEDSTSTTISTSSQSLFSVAPCSSNSGLNRCSQSQASFSSSSPTTTTSSTCSDESRMSCMTSDSPRQGQAQTSMTLSSSSSNILRDMTSLLSVLKVWTDYMRGNMHTWVEGCERLKKEGLSPFCVVLRESFARFATLIHRVHLSATPVVRRLIVLREAGGCENNNFQQSTNKLVSYELVKQSEDVVMTDLKSWEAGVYPTYAPTTIAVGLSTEVARINYIHTFLVDVIGGERVNWIRFSADTTSFSGVRDDVDEGEVSVSTPTPTPQETFQYLSDECVSEEEQEQDGVLDELEYNTNSSLPGEDSGFEQLDEIEILRRRKSQLHRLKAADERKMRRWRRKLQSVHKQDLRLNVSNVIVEVKPRYVVPDTNCLIEHLQQFTTLVDTIVANAHQSSSFPISCCVPVTVLVELDGLAKGVVVQSYNGASGRSSPSKQQRHGDVQHAQWRAGQARQALSYLRSPYHKQSGAVKCVTSVGSILTSMNITTEVVQGGSVGGGGLHSDGTITTNDDRILSACYNLSALTSESRRRSYGELEAASGDPSSSSPLIHRYSVLLTDDVHLKLKAHVKNVPVNSVKQFLDWLSVKPPHPPNTSTANRNYSMNSR